MITNYLRTAFRRIWKNKGFFALNFVGLYISVTASVLIALLIFYESSFDKGSGDGQVYRVVNQVHTEHGEEYGSVTPYPLAAALRVAMPGNSDICQINFDKEGPVLIGQQVFKAKNIVFADSVFPRLFPVVVKAGSLRLAEKGFVLLTQSAAQRYFGNDNAVGKRIKAFGVVDLEVAGVVADPAPNTHLPYSMIISWPSMAPDIIGGFPLDQWNLNAEGYVYIGLRNAGMVPQTERVLADLVEKNIHSKDPRATDHYSLQPVKAIHYDMRYATSNPSYTIERSYLTLIGAIGLFLILAACINYTNLSTAMAMKKGKEVGVRKTLGATRGQLMRQLLSETSVVTGIVILAAGVSVGFFLPVLNRFLDKPIPTAWLNFRTRAFLVGRWALVS